MVLLAAALAHGDGFRNPPESASALGQAGGHIALTDDASAVTVNPANLAGIEEPSAMVSVAMGYGQREFKPDVTGRRLKSEDPWSSLPSLFAAVPVGKDGVACGLGVTLPFGRFSRWEEDVPFRYSAPTFSELWVANINPTVAAKLGSQVSAAVGVSAYPSRIGFEQFFPWSAALGVPGLPDGKAKFSGEGVGCGANAAVAWRPVKGHALSLTYRSPFDVEYEGDFQVSNMPAPVEAQGARPTSDFKTEVQYPALATLGYAVQLTQKLRAGMDVEWLESSRNENMKIDIGLRNNALLPNRTIGQNWDDNWTYGVGCDYRVTEKWVARAGLIHLQTPTIAATTIPVAAEMDQDVVSLGCGYRDANQRVDCGYMIGIFDGGLRVKNQADPTLNGEYDFTSHMFAVSYSRAF
jgi:long-chain fatty acid transport protein